MTVTTAPQTLETRIATYESTRRRGIDFLLRHCQPSNALAAGVERVTYYRVPWALALAGETSAAHALLAWIEQSGLGPDGEFHGGLPWSTGANPALNTYRETLSRLRRPPASALRYRAAGMAFALPYQDPVTGGIYMDRGRTGPDAPQLLFPTAQFGMTRARHRPRRRGAEGRRLVQERLERRSANCRTGSTPSTPRMAWCWRRRPEPTRATTSTRARK